MRHTILLSLVLAALLLGGSVGAQECGNINGQGIIDLADMSHLAAYLGYGQTPYSPQMDIDGWVGVTMGDLVELTEYLFVDYMADSFDCTPDLNYSFAASPGDTIFIPRMLSIPAGVDSLNLPIRTSLLPGAQGVLVYAHITGSSSGFTLSEVVVKGAFNDGINGFAAYSNYDRSYPVFFIVRDRKGDSLSGSKQCLEMVYNGSGAGGAIDHEVYDRDAYRRTCVVRNGDVVIPTVVFYDYQLPPDTLKFAPTSLAFTSQAGREKNDTLTVNFTSSGSNITFDLTASEPWLTPVGTTFTTPATVKVTVNAAMLAQGNYAGTLAVSNATSTLGAVVPNTTIAAAVTVGPPVFYPPGDVSCDGILDLVDLSIIIARLMGDRGPIEPCY